MTIEKPRLGSSIMMVIDNSGNSILEIKFQKITKLQNLQDKYYDATWLLQ